MSEKREIVCADCESVPTPHETPYSETTEYVLTCDCGERQIDITDCVVDSNLVDPLSGKWSNIDGDNPNL